MKQVSKLTILLLTILIAMDVSCQKAEPNDDCDERGSRWCDFDSGLWCRAGKCQCFKNYMTYNPEKQRCLSKVWFPCGELSTGDVKLPRTDCVDNASCLPANKGRPNGTQECRCLKGFKETDDGFCT